MELTAAPEPEMAGAGKRFSAPGTFWLVAERFHSVLELVTRYEDAAALGAGSASTGFCCIAAHG